MLVLLTLLVPHPLVVAQLTADGPAGLQPGDQGGEQAEQGAQHRGEPHPPGSVFSARGEGVLSEVPDTEQQVTLLAADY